MPRLLAGIDVGTTGVRCMLFDLQGSMISGAYREYEATYLQPGWVEQDHHTMMAQTMRVCREAIDQAGVASEEIASIGFSSQGTLTIPIDQQGTLIRPVISWQDIRSQPDMPDILRLVSAESFYRTTGLPLSPIWIITKIHWMRQHEPALYEQTHKFIQHQDLILKVFGAEGYFTDLPSMSFYGVWDVREARWSDELLDRFDLVRDQFGQPTPPGTQVGTILPAIAAQTGFAVDTPICVGAFDQTCGGVGMGSIEPGMATVTLGTAGLTILVVDTPITGLGGLLTNHHAVSDLWQVEGVSLAAASSYRWFRDTFGTLEMEREKQQGGNAFNALNDLAAQAPPGSRGVLFLPYLSSAATPRWNPHARAAFIGMSMAHGRAELTRSVMEGVTLEMHDTMTGWYDNGMTVNTLRLGGGATHSPLWNQIQADVYGRRVQIMRIEESTALGAAILGGVGAGVFNSIQEGVDAMVHVASEIEPNMENHHIYEEMYSAYLEAYEGLNHKAFGTLAAMQVNP